MNRPGLALQLGVAILFLATGLPGAEPAAAAAAEKARAMTPGGMRGARGDEILRRFDKNGDGRIDEDERADAHEAMLKERLDRQRKFAAAGTATPQLRARMLELFDKNKDGRIDED